MGKDKNNPNWKKTRRRGGKERMQVKMGYYFEKSLKLPDVPSPFADGDITNEGLIFTALEVGQTPPKVPEKKLPPEVTLDNSYLTDGKGKLSLDDMSLLLDQGVPLGEIVSGTLRGIRRGKEK